jgi:hypothetical protein
MYHMLRPMLHANLERFLLVLDIAIILYAS